MTALEQLKPDQQRVVRSQVHDLLTKTQAFVELPPDERERVANRLVNIVAFLADPGAGQGPAMAQTLAQGTTRGRGSNSNSNSEEKQTPAGLRASKDLVQKDFSAPAAGAGAKAYKELVNTVDFPEFVSGLIDGVFNSIVDASIKQMEAYSALLENVAKSVDNFAKDNFSLNQGRDYLANRFPSLLRIDASDGQPTLQPTEAGEDGGLGEIASSLGIESEIDLSDETSEAELARRGQLEMARLRQKQLATMVLMGINRIVVTNGSINAKVMVDVRTHDTATRTNTASDFDSTDERDVTYSHTRDRGWPWSASTASGHTNTKTHSTVVSSSSTDTSTSDVKTRAQLTGEVRINFKSETFPLEKLASQTELEAVNQTTGGRS